MYSPSVICFNRNIMECKVNVFTIQMVVLIVLIETLWNVKTAGSGFFVETEVGFNRNIMECKVNQSVFAGSRVYTF